VARVPGRALVSGEITFGIDPVGKLEIKPLARATDAQKTAFEARGACEVHRLTKN
jgi:hypothetical protein